MSAVLTPTSKHRLSQPRSVWTKVIDSKQGVVEAIVSATGNRDSDGDVVVPGAHTYGLQTLAVEGLKPKGIAYHDWNMPIAKTVDAIEIFPGDPSLPQKLLDAKVGGLRVRAQMNMDPAAQKAREAFSFIEFYGDEQQWSVGYEVHESFLGGGGQGAPDTVLAFAAMHGGDVSRMCIKAIGDEMPPTNFITKWVVYEYSPVLFGANSLAMTENVKEANKVLPLLERIVVRLDAIDGKTSEPGTEYDQRVKDVEEAVGYLWVDHGTKAGRVQARRNEQRIRTAMETLQEMLDELAKENDDDGKDKPVRVEGKGVVVEFESNEALVAWLTELGKTVEAPADRPMCNCDESKDITEGVCAECWSFVEPEGELAKDKNHEFTPSEDNPRACATCGAGPKRPWHKDAEPEEDGKALSAADEMALMEFQMLAEELATE